ncbi:hypothetical protein [Agrococcus sp. TF02-05]|uniref:hypothetical protein n=1 Tax=Agrococcus sp. TF02-05 TaxID=2815211 RepID=UPI001AA13153|nr:hypothetical protein [Agrococcus sp. TF02-05]MBO1770216.1 hypothetical protein [Agrococcus sp. TF02-05]
MTRATTTITAHGRTLSATARTDLQPAVDALLQRFAELGEQWADGLVAWSSWSPIVMEARADGFVLRSPDFEADAREDRTDDLTIALETTEGIVRVLNAAGVLPQDVRFDQEVEAVRGWESHRELVLSRAPGRDARDSGWFVDLAGVERSEPWSADDVVDVPVWRVRMARPAVVRALALPVGVSASVVGDAVELVVDERDGAILARGPL